MTYSIIFLQPAVDDLDEIRRYVRKHFSQVVWQSAYAKIKRAISKLEQLPDAGHPVPELPEMHFLETIAAKNRVIYEVVGQIVYIHIICDTRQDFRTELARRPLRGLRT